MKIVPLVTEESVGASVTGSTVPFRPVTGYTSVFVVHIKRTTGTGAASSTTPTISLQGSLNGTDWVTVDSFAASTLAVPLAATDWVSTGGYRSAVKVVQGFPLMRVCTSGAISADMKITAYLGNG